MSSFLTAKFHDDISNGSRVIVLTNTPKMDTAENNATFAKLLLHR